MKTITTAIMFFFIAVSCYSEVIISKASGSWHDISTWDLGRIPNSEDVIVLKHSVTINKEDCSAGKIIILLNARLTVSDSIVLTANSINNEGEIYNCGTIQIAEKQRQFNTYVSIADGDFFNPNNWHSKRTPEENSTIVICSKIKYTGIPKVKFNSLQICENSIFEIDEQAIFRVDQLNITTGYLINNGIIEICDD